MNGFLNNMVIAMRRTESAPPLTRDLPNPLTDTPFPPNIVPQQVGRYFLLGLGGLMLSPKALAFSI